jgi:DNA-binding CsgD family transcriptional regulator
MTGPTPPLGKSHQDCKLGRPQPAGLEERLDLNNLVLIGHSTGGGVGCTPRRACQWVARCQQGGKVLTPLVAAKLADSVRHPPLTPRELTVLSHLAKGVSDKAIGNQLAVAAGTVKSHVKRILNKLGARGRTEAAAIARRRGLCFEDADWRGERAA